MWALQSGGMNYKLPKNTHTRTRARPEGACRQTTLLWGQQEGVWDTVSLPITRLWLRHLRKEKGLRTEAPPSPPPRLGFRRHDGHDVNAAPEWGGGGFNYSDTHQFR